MRNNKCSEFFGKCFSLVGAEGRFWSDGISNGKFLCNKSASGFAASVTGTQDGWVGAKKFSEKSACAKSQGKDISKRNSFPFTLSKRAQTTVFIIIAILLVAAAVLVFVFRDDIIPSGVPASMEPVYDSFLNCLEEETLVGVNVLESQGGYIELPEFEAGSSYMPFGSQLNFVGNPVPYWYYVSGNNIAKEQVPSMRNMESSLADFIEDNIRSCVFDVYYEQGFRITMEEPSANVDIKGNKIFVELDMKMGIDRADESAVVRSHSVTVDSELGNLYDDAREIYELEQDELFLENYAVDTLRLYAPVDGVEMTCAPLTWNAQEVFDELGEAIEVNTFALRTRGGDYSLSSQDNEYFVIDSDVNARFITSSDWASGFDVEPSEGVLLISEPVGNQQGLGILGFCYVPYHFVYSVKYPVLVQVYSGDEIFQFPVAVVVQGNQPRKALETTATEFEDFGFCEEKNTLIEVKTYDSRLNSVDADISYECFGATCGIGSTANGKLVEKFPQCVNGRIVAQAEGFEDAGYIFSTVNEGSADIILDRVYELDVQLMVDGAASSQSAIIDFVSDDGSVTISYPAQTKVELSEGQYEISVSVYENSSLTIESSTSQYCTEVASSGLGGIFGLTEEKCFEVEMPEQIVSNALAGGGSENYYMLESELAGSSVIEINADSFETPKTIEELQNNYILVEGKELGVGFK